FPPFPSDPSFFFRSFRHIPLQSVPSLLTKPERDAIVTHLDGLFSRNAARKISAPSNLVCLEDPRCLSNTATTSSWPRPVPNTFYFLSIGDDSAPRIPKVLDAFSFKRGYIVAMEKIAAPTLSACNISEEEAVEYAAFAMKWLIDQLPSVPDTSFGSILSKETPVLHCFFKEQEAPYVFSNPDELAEYVLKASKRCRIPPPSSVMEELLASFKQGRYIYHSDIRKENFLLDSDKVWIIDFQHIGVFPEVFQTFSFFNIDMAFAASVGRKLGYQPSSTANAMVRISNVLQQCGGAARLGK
ncbi:hypothetical protein BDP27DRAFT_901226, partial [Rhodocollybia butyracea]